MLCNRSGKGRFLVSQAQGKGLVSNLSQLRQVAIIVNQIQANYQIKLILKRVDFLKEIYNVNT